MCTSTLEQPANNINAISYQLSACITYILKYEIFIGLKTKKWYTIITVGSKTAGDACFGLVMVLLISFLWWRMRCTACGPNVIADTPHSLVDLTSSEKIIHL